MLLLLLLLVRSRFGASVGVDEQTSPHSEKYFIDILVLQGTPHQTSSTTTSGSNVNTNTPSPGPYSDQYGMYTTRLP